ncbi:hypothetical protein KCP75_25100 [Salmonella enterica subsp. enterica]|nr:hypothetical protein KCP75_25100 [Salmonella enterica subsp. enterica]
MLAEKRLLPFFRPDWIMPSGFTSTTHCPRVGANRRAGRWRNGFRRGDSPSHVPEKGIPAKAILLKSAYRDARKYSLRKQIPRQQH